MTCHIELLWYYINVWSWLYCDLGCGLLNKEWEMLNEGIISNDTKTLVKSAMVKQLLRLKMTTPDEWERATFESLTGHKREDVDWEFEDNQAGYYLWVKSFDSLIDELVHDGYASVEETEGQKRVIKSNETDPNIEYSFMAYPAGESSESK
jgi:hypothetical protein